jgi:hypothetical protein
VIDTVETITSFKQSNLIGQIKQAFTALPDARSGNGVYQKYVYSLYYYLCSQYSVKYVVGNIL